MRFLPQPFLLQRGEVRYWGLLRKEGEEENEWAPKKENLGEFGANHSEVFNEDGSLGREIFK